MKNKIKILLTTPYDLSIDGGVNRQLFGLYDELYNYPQFKIKILAPSLSPCLQNKDIVTMGKIITFPFNGAKSNVTLDTGIKLKVLNFLNDFKPDIIHLQEPLYPVLNLYVLKYSQAKNIGTFHTYKHFSLLHHIFKPFVVKYFKKLHEKIAVSESAKEYISNIFKSEYNLIHNSISLEKFKFLGQKLFDDQKKNILFVGRLTEPRKGFIYLLEAYRYLEFAYPGKFRLIVVGNQKNKWRKNAETGEIIWLGRVSDSQLNQLYASSDLLCAPSIRGESFGLVLLEAFAFGKPVVTFNIKGYSSLVEYGNNGFIAPLKDIRSLANSIQIILNNNELYEKMKNYAFETAKKYDQKIIVKKIISLYEKVLNV